LLVMIATVLALAATIRGFAVDLRIDRNTKRVRGTERIEVATPHELRLPLKGQRVEAVSCGDKAASFDIDNSMLVVGSCDARTITIRYTAQEPKGINFTPSLAYSGFDSCTWMICDDSPSVRAPITTTLHAPPGEWTLATGILQSVTNDADGWRTFTWRDEAARSAYLYGFAIGKLQTVSVTERDAVLIALSADLSEAALMGVLRHSEEMVGFFQRAAGCTLPHNRYTQLIVNGSAAQEKSTYSIIGTDELAALAQDPAEDWVIAHEMAHQFWGNSVTPESWTEMWLSEGVVTFMTAAWKEHRWGRAAYDREMALAERRVKSAIDSGYDKPLVWPGEYPSLRLRRAITYSRGALFMDQLRRTLGEASFWRALRTYTAAFANRTVTSRDFQHALERSSRKDLAPLFRDWVYGQSATRD
jgi:aminopeptidase N